ncbi:hypothetical protein CERZMDRAFT_97542 [Cercospora zeae-maydis SCOH1-5]|uniref:Uncharacterized protein n=1 Tax=Cercospora zeae-maydis SCOH1-5 TaxID=717836 RepID=A0A6A6FG25_9PEZI|nr:hypothetical protein CERZMDRAFT_97542 [Cercospora zeae-maydis SCOH1-5]
MARPIIEARMRGEAVYLRMLLQECALLYGERATRLNLLAAISLPLTLATGIFGMNIRQVSGEAKGPGWRPVACVAGPLLGLSLILIIVFWLWTERKRGSGPQDHNQIEAQMGEKRIEQRGNRLEREASHSGQRPKRDGRKWHLPNLGCMKGKSKKNKRK